MQNLIAPHDNGRVWYCINFCVCCQVEKFEIFTAVKIQVKVFWVVMPCSIVVGYQCFRPCCLNLQGDVGGIMVLKNVGILPQHYMVSQPRRPQPEYKVEFIFLSGSINDGHGHYWSTKSQTAFHDLKTTVYQAAQGKC
jgi:hypothetical protein